jgi:hypothetical protein
MKKVMFVKLPVSILKEGERFVVYSPALDLSTSGKTYSEAKKRFAEIVDIFFEEIGKKGNTEIVLEELGWKKVQTQWQPPIVISQESELFRVPAI